MAQNYGQRQEFVWPRVEALEQLLRSGDLAFFATEKKHDEINLLAAEIEKMPAFGLFPENFYNEALDLLYADMSDEGGRRRILSLCLEAAKKVCADHAGEINRKPYLVCYACAVIANIEYIIQQNDISK